MKVCKGQLNAIDDYIYSDLWHRRPTNMSGKGLQLLAMQPLIPMAKGKLSHPCDYCLFGKQHKVSFHKNSTRKLEKFLLEYFDVCGPMEVNLLGSNRCFVTFIDDASRKTWIYLLQTKSQVF